MNSNQIKITDFFKVKSDITHTNNSLKKCNTIISKKAKLSEINDVIILSDDEESENVHENRQHAQIAPNTPPVSPKKKKYYSPTKKRMVSFSNSTKSYRKNLIGDLKNNTVNINSNNKKTSIEYNDKTKNFLLIIENFLKDTTLLPLLDNESILLLTHITELKKPGASLVCRLFWRRKGWYRQDNLCDIVQKNNYPVVEIEEEIMECMFSSLVNCGILEKGDNRNMSTMEDFTQHLIQAEEIKEICNFLKIKKCSKKDGIKALKSFALSTTSITNYMLGGPQGNINRVVEIMRKRVGECYRLSEKAYKTIHRLYILNYLGIPYDFIRDNGLEHLVDYERRAIETFPISDAIPLNNASLVFQNASEFEHYVAAIEMYEEFLQNTDKAYRALVVQNIYQLYKGLSFSQLQNYHSLSPWLRRYTPAYIYINIMLEGLNTLKTSNKLAIHEEAINILTSLINQDIFKIHHKTRWHDERALILHKYLKRSDEAAKELIAGFVIDVPEYQKDLLRPRALYLANLKSAKILDCLRQLLQEYGSSPWTMENTLKSTRVSILPMEKKGRGNSLYEIHNHDGTKHVAGVEECAKRWYANNTHYTEGGHWEGKIIVNIFFLIFWDIIYNPLPNIKGVYLSRYQRYPLDLFSESFYENRRDLINDRLVYIQKSPVDIILKDMEHVWNTRPVSEQNGISRDARGWREVVKALGTHKLAIICQRIANDFRYTHSGFPDLTLYDPKNNKVKFVEVKSDSDKPSIKQLQWMHFLHKNGIDTEFCYVGAKTNGPSSRRQKKTSSNDSLNDVVKIKIKKRKTSIEPS